MTETTSLIGTTWYRYADQVKYDSSERPHHVVSLKEYKVIAETKATVVLVSLEDFYHDTNRIVSWAVRKRVMKDARKRFAYPTKALAWNSYRIRNDWRVFRLEADLNHAKCCQAYIKLVDGLTT